VKRTRGNTRGRPENVHRSWRPGCIDLFAGAGGLAEGFRQAGWRILSGADADPYSAETFRLNFPRARFYEQDVAGLDPKRLLTDAGLKAGELGCLIGGPPCQSFSYNNHARSASGKRARLFRHYLKLVGALRPKTLVMENVPGMLTIGNGRIANEIHRKLAQLGYWLEVRILYSEDFGVPQQRRRVFVIATRLGRDDSLFPRGTHGPSVKPSLGSNDYVHRWTPRNGERPRRLVTVWDAISDLPQRVNGGGPVPYGRKPRTDFQKHARRGSRTVKHHIAHKLTPKMLHRIKNVPEGGDWRDLPRRLLPAGMKRARPNDHTKRYGRLARRGLCCTILTKCDPHWGSYVHPLEHRTITAREAARLQTFPDRFKFCAFISKQYEQIGNAVPPLLAKRIAQTLKRHLRRKAASGKRAGERTSRHARK